MLNNNDMNAQQLSQHFHAFLCPEPGQGGLLKSDKQINDFQQIGVYGFVQFHGFVQWNMGNIIV